MRNVIEILKEREFIEATTSEDLQEWASKPQKVYCGFDPTSDSLHLGNLVALVGLAWFHRCGHTPVAVIGGATGMIGDPSGKSHERNLLDEASLRDNERGIAKNVHTVLAPKQGCPEPVIVNNYDWFKETSLLTFLREIGKHFRLGPMLAKEGVRNRWQSEEGLSFTEFSYQLLQGTDYLHLYDQFGVTLQVGGSDQWGNITAGIDLVRKLRGISLHGLTFPLMTRSDGKKFGKSEEGAIWLSPDKLSPYRFYQYLVRIPDADVVKLLKMLTFLEMDEIRSIQNSMSEANYQPNTAQKRLAEEVTRLVHGENGLQKALAATQGVSPGAEASLDANQLNLIAGEVPHQKLPKSSIQGRKLIDVVVMMGAKSSKGEVRRLIRNGGVSLNNQKVTDENHEIQSQDWIDEKFLLIALGKKNKWLLEVT